MPEANKHIPERGSIYVIETNLPDPFPIGWRHYSLGAEMGQSHHALDRPAHPGPGYPHAAVAPRTQENPAARSPKTPPERRDLWQLEQPLKEDPALSEGSAVIHNFHRRLNPVDHTQLVRERT